MATGKSDGGEISDGRWEKKGGGAKKGGGGGLFPLMPHKEFVQLLRYLVPGALDLPELLWAAALVGVVDPGGLPASTVNQLEVDAGRHAQNGKVSAEVRKEVSALMGGGGSLTSAGGREGRAWGRGGALLPGRGASLRASVPLLSLLAFACVVLDLAWLAGFLERAVAVVGCTVEGDDVILVCLVVEETVRLESVAV